MDEFVMLSYKKTKNGWICTDQNGNSGTGVTKQLAKNQYYILHQVKQSTIPTVNMAAYNKGF